MKIVRQVTLVKVITRAMGNTQVFLTHNEKLFLNDDDTKQKKTKKLKTWSTLFQHIYSRVDS